MNFVFKVKSNERCWEGQLQAPSRTACAGRIAGMEAGNKMSHSRVSLYHLLKEVNKALTKCGKKLINSEW